MATSPKPDQIRALRAAAGLTQSQAAAMVHGSLRSWQEWEAGDADMHPGLWELFYDRAHMVHVVPVTAAAADSFLAEWRDLPAGRPMPLQVMPPPVSWGALTDLTQFLLNRVSTNMDFPNLQRMELAHNDVVLLRQLLDKVKNGDGPIDYSLKAGDMVYSAHWWDGVRAMEVVDVNWALLAGAFRLHPANPNVSVLPMTGLRREPFTAEELIKVPTNPHEPGTLAHDVWQRGFMGKTFSGHPESVAAGWFKDGDAARHLAKRQKGGAQ